MGAETGRGEDGYLVFPSDATPLWLHAKFSMQLDCVLFMQLLPTTLLATNPGELCNIQRGASEICQVCASNAQYARLRNESSSKVNFRTNSIEVTLLNFIPLARLCQSLT